MTRDWVVVAGVSLVSTGLAAYEIVPASVTPLVRAGLGVGPGAAGLVVSVMFGTAVVTSVPIGVALDRTNSRVAVAVSTLAFLVAGAWGWAAATDGAYRSLLASRVLGGVAYTVVWNAGIDVVGRSFDDGRRATAVGAFTASGPLGFALGQFTGPLLAKAAGWPAVFPAFAALAVVGTVAFWPASRGRGRTAEGVDAPSAAELGAVLTDRRVWTVGGIGTLAFALYLFANSWLPAYFTSLGLPLALGGLLAALFPAVGIVARVGGGALSDRLFGGRRRPVVLVSFLVAAPAMAGFALAPAPPVLLALVVVAGGAIQLTLGLQFAYVRELVAPSVAATAVAFQTSVGLLGAFAAPVAGGWLVGRVGYPATFLLAGALGVVGLLLAVSAPEPTG